MSKIKSVNDFVIKFANVNGSGSASANQMFAKGVFRSGIPVSPKNIFPSNIQGLPTWFEVRVNEKGYLGRREGIDIFVAMNPQSYQKDVAELKKDGYLIYDSSWKRDFGRDDINVLDLGCGSGVIGIALMKSFAKLRMHCSDVHSTAVEITKKNFIKNKLRADIRTGNLFEPWIGKKFDYIINDVTAISALVAKISPWFQKNIPCESGNDGTDLAISILKKSPNFLNKNGSHSGLCFCMGSKKG